MTLQVYTCHISAYQLTELHHTLQIRTRPKIVTTPDQLMIVREGSPVMMACEAVAGNPTPSLTWRSSSSAGDVYRRVAVSDNKATLSLGSVSRSSAGQYTCVADNGFDNAVVEKTVHLEVHCKYNGHFLPAAVVTFQMHQQ